MTLTHAIQIEAQRLGFAPVSVTSSLPPPHYDQFDAWLNAGLHAEMAYLAKPESRLRRADPHQILPECRSVLVLGLPYASSLPDLKPPGSPYRGSVASYAWDEDYHLTIPPRLDTLVAFIESQVGKKILHACYTDSGPILERDLAQRAGLGWIGKNTNLINPQMGSSLLLAEILLGIDLEISQPFTADHCGTCQRCIEACPTGCILPDRTLDTSRCISYLTIENKGSIPQEHRSKMGGWIFGCDICQQVCPWNQRAINHAYDKEIPPPAIACPDLIEVLSLTKEHFNHLYKRSPIKRTKRSGYLRNAAVALGNRLAEYPNHPERSAAVAGLKRALLDDPQLIVRGHAAWALGKASEKVILQQAYLNEKESEVLEEIRLALAM